MWSESMLVPNEAMKIGAKIFALLDLDRDGKVDGSDLEELTHVLEKQFGSVQVDRERNLQILKEVLHRSREGYVDQSDIQEGALRAFCGFTEGSNLRSGLHKENILIPRKKEKSNPGMKV